MQDPRGPTNEPVTEVLLDRRNVRGLAHPLRIKMLGLLREHGPATATGLARRLGESSGATSYHLRQLEQYGFIVEAEGMGTRRERWWRAAHQITSFDLSGDVGGEEQILGLEYLRGSRPTTAPPSSSGWKGSLSNAEGVERGQHD